MDDFNHPLETGPAYRPSGSFRTRIWMAIVVGPLIAVTITILASANFKILQTFFCPANTFIAGHFTGIGFLVGVLLAGITPVLAAVILLRFGVYNSNVARKVLIISGFLLTAAGFGLLALNFGTFYCATPKNIYVYHIYSVLKIHNWRDVTQLKASCMTDRKGRVSVNLGMQLTDGSWIGLGGDSTPLLIQHYHQIGGLTQHATYDNASMGECDSHWRAFFAHRPS